MGKKSTRIIALWALLAGAALSAGGGYGTPAEFGSEPLSLTPLQPADTLRQWGKNKTSVYASLQGIRGNWGRNGEVRLVTPRGRALRMPARYLSENEREYVAQWLKDNGFIPLPTANLGTLHVRLLSVSPTAIKGQLSLQLITPDGKANSWIIEDKPALKGKGNTGTISLTAEGLQLVKQWQQQQSAQTHSKPCLPVAATANEALVYSELRGVNTVILFLGRRGGGKDTAFRHYLSQHPEAAAEWAQRYVFLLVYAEDDGSYSPQICHELNTLANHHHVQPDGYTQLQPGVIASEMAYQSTRFNNDVLSGITLIGNADVGNRHVLLQRIFAFNLSMDEFLNTQPNQVRFLQQ
jgi:hypothetical protein